MQHTELALLTENELAELLKVSAGTLRNNRYSDSEHIPYIRVGGAIRYRVEDIDDYLSSKVVRNSIPAATQSVLNNAAEAAITAGLNSESIDFALADEAAALCTSFTRLPYLLNLYKRFGSNQSWWKLFGEWWSMCDNFCEHYDHVNKIFSIASRDQTNLLMNDQEKRFLDALPNEVNIFRGTAKGSRTGFSWTLDKNVAMRFPTLNRYRTNCPVLRSASIRKELILAIKLDRDESEVIVKDGFEFMEIEHAY